MRDPTKTVYPDLRPCAGCGLELTDDVPGGWHLRGGQLWCASCVPRAGGVPAGPRHVPYAPPDEDARLFARLRAAGSAGFFVEDLERRIGGLRRDYVARGLDGSAAVRELIATLAGMDVGLPAVRAALAEELAERPGPAVVVVMSEDPETGERRVETTGGDGSPRASVAFGGPDGKVRATKSEALASELREKAAAPPAA